MKPKRVSQEYILLDLFDNLTTARKRLGENPLFVAVILDDAKKPVTMITSADLVNLKESDDQPILNFVGQLPPGLIIDASLSMDELIKSPEFSAFSIGAKGAIVFDKDILIGIITEQTMLSYLKNEFTLVGKMRGVCSDSRLPGSIVNNPIIIYCEEFNHRNELVFFNRHNPPQCQEKKPYLHPIRKW